MRPEPRGNPTNNVFSTELDTAFYVPNSSTSSTGINPTGLNQGSATTISVTVENSVTKIFCHRNKIYSLKKVLVEVWLKVHFEALLIKIQSIYI